MLRIDHFCVGVRHLYEGAARFREETGLDPYDGGWFMGWGGAQRTIPIGKDCYVEIESVIDHSMARDHYFGRWFESVLALDGDHLVGWVVTVESMDELEAVAERIGTTVERTWGRVRPDGQRNRAWATAVGKEHGWPRGLPIYQLWEDMDDHPDRIEPARHVRHRVHPHGISWVEVGDEALTREWLGPGADAIDVRYVDGPAGLYGVGIAADEGEIVVRKPPVPLELAGTYGA